MSVCACHEGLPARWTGQRSRYQGVLGLQNGVSNHVAGFGCVDALGGQTAAIAGSWCGHCSGREGVFTVVPKEVSALSEVQSEVWSQSLEQTCW